MFASHGARLRFRQMWGFFFLLLFFFLASFKFGETQTSGHLLLMNVKSNVDLFRKSKHFHTYDRAISRVRSNHPGHLISCLCSCCQLCTSVPTRQKLWFEISANKCRMYVEEVEKVFMLCYFFPPFMSYHLKLLPIDNISFCTRRNLTFSNKTSDWEKCLNVSSAWWYHVIWSYSISSWIL